MTERSDVEHPLKTIPSDSRREAMHAVRGYDWQRWLTVLTWLLLKDEENLWIEWAEDFTVTGPGNGGFTVQAKDRGAPISLGQAQVQEIVSRALERPPSVQTLVWTSAKAGNERGLPFPEPGVLFWESVVEGRQSPDALRHFLLDAPNLSAAAKVKISAANDNEFRELLGRLRWAVDEKDLSGLRDKTLVAVELRMTELAIRNASLSRGVMAALLFDAVARRSILQPVEERRLTRIDLDQYLVRWNREHLDAAAPEILAKIGADRLAIERVDNIPARSAAPWSFAWFVYTTKAIPLIGRVTELALLRRFADDPAPFLWWAVGGAGGLGKSRLAQEIMLEYAACCTTGFVRTEKLQQVLGDLTLQSKDVLLTIDYAAIDQHGVANFLVGCLALASPSRRIRVLLTDRDPSDHAEWWRTLLTPLSSQTANMLAHLHAEPLRLNPLVDVDRTILDAWLLAGGSSAFPDASAWHRIGALCGGNPLLLGFAAAAIEVGDERFDSIGDLLRGLNRREWIQIRQRAPDDVALAVATDLAAAATLARMPLAEMADTDVLVLLSPDASEVVMIETQDGEYRLPTFGDFDTGALSPDAFPDIKAFRDKQREAMGRLVGPHPVADAFDCARAIYGVNLQVQPDLLGEFFLAECWQASASALKPGVIPVVDDDRLARQLRAAWRVAPKAILFTLEQLRQHAWAEHAFLRAITRLPGCVAADDDDGDVDQLASCLFNATVKLGGAKTGLDARRRLFAALDTLATLRPLHDGVAYRRMKSLTQMLNLLDGEMRYQGWRDFLIQARDRQSIWLSKSEDFELLLMDAAQGFGRMAARRLEAADIRLTLSVLDALISADIQSEELDLTAAALYFSISVTCSRPDVPPGDDTEQTLDFARATLPVLVASAERFIAFLQFRLPQATEELAKAFVNASLAALKLREFDETYRLVGIVDALLANEDYSESGRLTAIHACHNRISVDLERNDEDALKESLHLAFDIVAPAAHSLNATVVFLQILRNVSSYALDASISTKVLLVQLLAKTPWTLAEPGVRGLLFQVARNSIAGFTVERWALPDVIQIARESACQGDIVEFLQTAAAPFDPSASVDTETGLVAYLEALEKADLGPFHGQYVAAAIAAFWFAHDGVAPTHEAILPFRLAPESEGVRVTIGDVEHGTTSSHYFEHRPFQP